jgi:hypothetical protein
MKVLVKEDLTVPMVVVMDLVNKVVDMVAENFLNSRKRVLSRRQSKKLS